MREGSLGFERTGKGSNASADAVKQVSEEFLGYVAELAPDAVEIMNPTDRQHYAEFTTLDGKKHRVPCVSRSDHHCIEEFADEEDVADDILPLLLLRLSATMRMMAYAVSVAKPSGGGLKLDLDRFRRDADELIREMKKDADRFIAEARESMAAELDEDEN